MFRMATPAKIDLHELDRLLKENTPTSEIAKHFNCTPGAVSQAKRKLNVAMAQRTATKEAPALIEKRLTAMDRLMDLAEKCENQLLWIAYRLFTMYIPPATSIAPMIR